jgi:hypothetical protein
VSDETKASIDDALQELQIILRAVSTVSTLDRLWAFRYTDCRNRLLESEVRSALPGFLYQCVSVDNFHSFIRLFHFDAHHRHDYIDDAFEKCWAFRIEHKLAREASVPLDKVRAELMPPRPRLAAGADGNILRL